MSATCVDSKILDRIIVGRVEPHIYGFVTQTVPNYMKVGDTYRPVEVRLDEWREKFPNLTRMFAFSAMIDENTLFRDYAVHDYLENTMGKTRLKRETFKDIYYSNEFFKDTTTDDVKEAMSEIKKSAETNDGRFRFYTPHRLPIKYTYKRQESLEPRENQRKVIDSFMSAVSKGRKNLLMYAVMRFGKTFTSMCCAKKIGAKAVLVVSAKADVADEWKQTVEGVGNFEGYFFATKDDLKTSSAFIEESLTAGKKVVLFLTLQDLQGEDIKRHHAEVFSRNWDMILVDETHFGARAEKYGASLNSRGLSKAEFQAEQKRQNAGTQSVKDLQPTLKELKSNVRVHLSGTPYRVLMGTEFAKEDLIAFVQFSDIADERDKWIERHRFDADLNEWDNPYYGFPEMIRFAFQPNDLARKRIEELKANGATASFSEIFRPRSISGKEGYRQFVHEDAVIDFLLSIDGSKADTQVLGFLDHDSIKRGKMCRHIVMVLPYCASCDAMAKLIEDNGAKFRNLSDYEIINVAGFDNPRHQSKPRQVKDFIAKCESEGKRTITLTVNKMLTGNTVEQWDTMLYLKPSASPEEYDQAVYRLQNPFVVTYRDKAGNTVKYNNKPQTLLVDFDPERMFRLQERKSQIYNINTDSNGNGKLRQRLEKELRVSPIIFLDNNKLRQVEPTDILATVRNYASTRSVVDEARDTPVDLSLLGFDAIKDILSQLNPIDSRKGLYAPAHKSADGQTDDTNPTVTDPNTGKPTSDKDNAKPEDKTEQDMVKRFGSLYALLLFFAFLTDDTVKSLDDIMAVHNKGVDNRRIFKSLGLNKEVIRVLQKHLNGFSISRLDYKIENTNSLINDCTKPPLDRATLALTKFSRMSDSEIVTPQKLADEIVALMPGEIDSSVKYLDIASKQGEFAVAFMKRYGEKIKDKVYSVCTSPLAYELTRKIYALLQFEIKNIFTTFHSYDLIDKDKQQKLTTKLKNMKFTAVVGNPPYNVLNAGDGNGADPLYHLFIDKGSEIANAGALVHPARFLFNAGKTPKDWNERILNDPHFKVVDYWVKSNDVFDNVDVKGGIAVTMWDKGEKCGPIGFFSPYKEVRSILTKVERTDQKSFADLVYPRDLYKLTETLYQEHPEMEGRQSQGHRLDIGSSIFDIFPELFFDEKPSDEYIGLYGLDDRTRKIKWIKRSYIKLPDNIDKYKVFVPKSNGTGAIGEVLSTPVIGVPVIGHTLTFLSIGSFSEAPHAEACLKYVKSRFARLLLGTLKVTQDNPKDTWANVPMQDFTEGSDIDWSKSVEEIDAQLYAKYGLTDDEIRFIQSMIKPM